MADFDDAPLASLSLTHVYYDPNDNLSYLCAWLALLPQALCIVYATLIWSTREAEVALTFLGQLVCEAANFALKRLIKEERPRKIHGKGYGMPSSHAQFVAFWSVSVALFLLLRHRPRVMCAASPATDRERAWSVFERAATSAVALVLAAVVAWSRVYLNYHTERQVLVGVTAGVVCALGWFVFTGLVRQMGLLHWAMELPIARLLRVRDLVVEEDPCQAGWEKWEAMIKGRNEKKAS